MGYPASPLIPEGKFVPVGEDRKIFVIDIGSGKPTVFLHGGGPGGTGWTDFGPVVPYFEPGRRLLLVDMLGRGQSSKPEIHEPIWSFHARHIVKAMDELGVDKADFICSSIGGSAALCIAAEYPERVNKVVLTGSAPMVRDQKLAHPDHPKFNGGEYVGAFFADPTREKCREIMALGEWYDDSLIPEETVDIRWHQSMDPELLALQASGAGRGEPQDLEEKLKTIEAQILFMFALHDPMGTPEYALSLARTVPRGDVYLMDLASHHLEEERPADYSAIVLAFLNRPELTVAGTPPRIRKVFQGASA